MLLEPKELKNKMKEMLDKKKDLKLNIEKKLMMNYWMLEDNNNLKRNKDYRSKLN
jgi:hypothetical protein